MAVGYETFNHEALFSGFDMDALASQINTDIDAMPEEAKAVNALTGILQVVDEDGNTRSVETITAEVTDFFERPEIKEIQENFNRAAMMFAAACMVHAHGSELSAAEGLTDIHETGMKELSKIVDRGEAKHNDDDDDDSFWGRRRRAANRMVKRTVERRKR